MHNTATMHNSTNTLTTPHDNMLHNIATMHNSNNLLHHITTCCTTLQQCRNAQLNKHTTAHDNIKYNTATMHNSTNTPHHTTTSMQHTAVLCDTLLVYDPQKCSGNNAPQDQSVKKSFFLDILKRALHILQRALPVEK